MPRAFQGKISPDGKRIAYRMNNSWDDERRNYRGGQNRPIWIMDLASHEVTSPPWTDSKDIDPVWVGDVVYFISDRDGVQNVWSYANATKQLTQVTKFRDFDVKTLDASGNAVVFEQAGYIHELDPATGREKIGEHHRRRRLPVDDAAVEGRRRAHDGHRALADRQARGGRGARRDLHDPGREGRRAQPDQRERRRRRSRPCGRRTDARSRTSAIARGEYKLYIAPQEGMAPPREIALPEPSRPYAPSWSPERPPHRLPGLALPHLARGRRERAREASPTPIRTSAARARSCRCGAPTRAGSRIRSACRRCTARSSSTTSQTGEKRGRSPTASPTRRSRRGTRAASTCGSSRRRTSRLNSGLLDMSAYEQPRNARAVPHGAREGRAVAAAAGERRGGRARRRRRRATPGRETPSTPDSGAHAERRARRRDCPARHGRTHGRRRSALDDGAHRLRRAVSSASSPCRTSRSATTRSCTRARRARCSSSSPCRRRVRGGGAGRRAAAARCIATSSRRAAAPFATERRAVRRERRRQEAALSHAGRSRAALFLVDADKAAPAAGHGPHERRAPRATSIRRPSSRRSSTRAGATSATTCT